MVMRHSVRAALDPVDPFANKMGLVDRLSPQAAKRSWVVDPSSQFPSLMLRRRTFGARFACWIAAVFVGLLSRVAAQDVEVTQPEPKTRQETLLQMRARKAEKLSPPKASWLQRQLTNLENEQTLEDAFEAPSPSAGGFYLTLGRIKTGAGLTLGSGYNSKGWLNDQVFLSVGAAGSMRKYWSVEAEVALPRLADGKVFASVHTGKNYFPQEDFFGTGPESQRDDRVSYLYRDIVFGATAGVNVLRWLSVGGGLEHIAPLISGGHDGRFPSIEEEFTEEEAPGLTAQPDFVRTEAFADVNYTSPRGNPRVGGRYMLTYSYYEDRDLDQYSFSRLDIDLRQYVSLLRQRRILALRALASFTDPATGHFVPFYYLPTLGGSRTLRGFRDFRFRDRHLLLLQAEYRYEIFPALSMVLFYDTGKVASDRADINLDNLESDYGFGVRVGTDTRGFFLLDTAFGGGEGVHLIMKFSFVF